MQVKVSCSVLSTRSIRCKLEVTRLCKCISPTYCQPAIHSFVGYDTSNVSLRAQSGHSFQRIQQVSPQLRIVLFHGSSCTAARVYCNLCPRRNLETLISIYLFGITWNSDLLKCKCLRNRVELYCGERDYRQCLIEWFIERETELNWKWIIRFMKLTFRR